MGDKQPAALQLVGFVTSGMADHPETHEAVNWTGTLPGPQNAAQARWWMGDCGLAVRPVYVGQVLTTEPLQGYEGAAATLRNQHALIKSQSALIGELVEALEIAQESWGKTAFPSEIINMALAKANRQ
jgi:hypothetical protein